MANLIFNSDDFGSSLEANLAILEGHSCGVITSTSILANGEFYKQGIEEVLPEIPAIGRGIHLNLTKGKSFSNPSLFADTDGIFNKNYFHFLYNSADKKLLAQIEHEFRTQIEKIMSDVRIDHINSHAHIHAIPNIFNLVVKLALEYKIKYVRLHYERPCFVFHKMFDLKYPVNLVKLGVLNTFSIINNHTISNLNSKSKKIGINNYLIGINYDGYMDESAILRAAKGLKNTGKNKIIEIVTHPMSLGYDGHQTNYNEFVASLNPKVKEEFLNAGFKLTNYNKLIF